MLVGVGAQLTTRWSVVVGCGHRSGRCAVTIERRRIDRRLDAALAVGGDLVQVASVLGIGEGTAIRDVVNARELL